MQLPDFMHFYPDCPCIKSIQLLVFSLYCFTEVLNFHILQALGIDTEDDIHQLAAFFLKAGIIGTQQDTNTGEEARLDLLTEGTEETQGRVQVIRSN